MHEMALEAWERKLMTITSGKGKGKVVAIATAKGKAAKGYKGRIAPPF
jgi:hypothetical protein